MIHLSAMRSSASNAMKSVIKLASAGLKVSSSAPSVKTLAIERLGVSKFILLAQIVNRRPCAAVLNVVKTVILNVRASAEVTRLS